MDYLKREIQSKADEMVKACKECSENEMQRNLASSHEAYANIKELIEKAKEQNKEIEKLVEDLWKSIKSGNDDEWTVIYRQIAASAELLAQTWGMTSAIGERAEIEV